MSRSLAPELVTADDLVEFDLNSNPVDARGRALYSERFIHGEIYKARPDVQSILHYHPDELVAVSVAGVGVKVVANCGVHFYRGIPIFDSPTLIRTEALGDRVAETLGDRNAVLLRGHGGTAVADNLDNLMRLGINLVRTARIQIMAASLGPVKTHSHAEAEDLLQLERSGKAIRRFLDYYISEVLD